MTILPISGVGTNKPLASTDASASVAMLAQPVPNIASNIRVVNGTTSKAYVAFGASGVAATSADYPVLPGSERIISWLPTATHAAAILATAAATGVVDFQLVQGV